MEIKASLEGCDNKQKQQLEQLIEPYWELFQEPNVLPPKKEVEDVIQLLLESPLPKIRLYWQSLLEDDKSQEAIVVALGATSH
jgi:hypothetical protein